MSATIPDLIALTKDDEFWTWDRCVACGSANITHRGLYMRSANPARKEWEVSRVAWCNSETCQKDRADTEDVFYPTIPEAATS